MSLLKVRCESLTALLMNRLDEATLEQLRTKVKPPKAARIGNTRTPREDAEPKLYKDAEGRIYMPALNLYAAMIAAGQSVRLDGKRQVSTAKASILPSFCWIQETMLYLFDPQNEKKAIAWEADVRAGKNPNGGEAVCIVRPRFDRWGFEMTLEFDEREVGANLVREILDKAGSRIGVGDFRPARKGVFGRFHVTSWKEAAKAA